MFTRTHARLRAVRVLVLPLLAGALAGCTAAGFPQFMPYRMVPPVATAAAAPVAADPITTGSIAASAGIEDVAPVPLMRPRFSPDGATADTPALAFAPQPQSARGVDGLILKYAQVYGVPEALIRRVVQHESGYNPRAKNGPYYGLMQISHATARSMGYRGKPSGLLDPDVNLKYAVKYLRGAYLTAGYNSDRAVRFYKRGYYYDAKRLGLLDTIGLN